MRGPVCRKCWLPPEWTRGYARDVVRPRDTTDEAHAVQLEAYRKMGPERRVLLAFEMSERAREIAIAGVLAREPELGPEQARVKVMRRILGDALYDAAYASRGRT